MNANVLHEKKIEAQNIYKKLLQMFPDAGMMLRYTNNWELLVAVILSAQCTDKKVNQVTPQLFLRYPKLSDYLTADVEEFEKLIFSTGYYRNKTKLILSAAKKIAYEFHGEVPKTMEQILTIPGVARKTANVVLGNAYGVVEGIAVDTHVKRLSYRLGLSNSVDPKKIENDLMEIFPQKQWFHLTYLLIEYGRLYCTAKRHRETQCPLGHYR